MVALSCILSVAQHRTSFGAFWQSCMHCLLQYAEFIAALQPQMAEDTRAATQHPTTAVGAVQLEDAPEPSNVPDKLMMQPQPQHGDVPATQPTVGFRNTVSVEHVQESGASQLVHAGDSLDDHCFTVSDGPIADDV